MATVAEGALEACGEDKGRLLLLTTPLLEWVCLRQLPVEARLSVSLGSNSDFIVTNFVVISLYIAATYINVSTLQSARGVANLLEVMEGSQRTKLFRKHSKLL